MTINCKGTLVDLSSPKVMGILNITPDSFFDGGKYKNESEILGQVEKMLFEGATFIDVGAYSSRPGAKHISEKQELQRIVPVIELLIKKFPEIIISVDTFRSAIARETIDAGAAIINDISGGKMDDNMFKTVANLRVPYILMHMLGTPQNMQLNPVYKDVIQEIISFFAEQIFKLHQLEINDIIIDVGWVSFKHTYPVPNPPSRYTYIILLYVRLERDKCPVKCIPLFPPPPRSRSRSRSLSLSRSLSGPFYTSESRGGVERRQLELKGVEGGD